MFKFNTVKSLLILSCGLLLWTSCSKDDDDKGVSSEDLVGTWVETECYQRMKVAGEVINERTEPFDVSEQHEKITFKANGTFTEAGETGEWKLNGNKLTVIYKEEGTFTITIISLNATTFVFEYTATYTEEGVKYEEYHKSTNKKIS